MTEFPTFTDDLKTEIIWFVNNTTDKELASGIKQQKFLLLYNLFKEIKYKKGNFTSLQAWDNGPVYTQVYSAIKYHYTYKELLDTIKIPYTIDEKLAYVSKFIVEILSDEEVSELTHEFNFWKKSVDSLNQAIEIKNISISDLKKIDNILNLYNLDFILEHKVIRINSKIFLVKYQDYALLIDRYINQLNNLAVTEPTVIELNNNKINIVEQINVQNIINA